jgi:hypothetical protein
LVIDNTSSGNISTALIISSSGGGSTITTAMDLSAVNIVTALALGSNDVTVGGVTIDATEFARLDGKDAALVDINDAVSTAITGTGALNSGSITSGFGSIDTGTDNITTTGSIFANDYDRTTAGALTFGNTNATSVSFCNSAACDTITLGTNTDADTISIGDGNDTLTLSGNSSSTFVLNGVTVDATEFNRLDGHDAALVDTNDAVSTAITGTGALNSGSITSGFGSIDTGADNITTTGSVFANDYDRTTAGALTFGNTNATSVSVCNSAACDTITLGTNADADSITIGDASDTVALNATNWSITSGGAGTFASITRGGDTITDFTGNGLTVSTGALTVLVAPSADALSGTTSSGSGLEVLSSGLAMLQGCADGQVLKWNETTDVWECSADNSGGASSFTSSGGIIDKTTASDRLRLLYGDAADTQLTIENTTNAIIPTVDASVIDLTGGTTGIVTNGVDGLSIAAEFGNGTANTNAGLHIAISPVNTPSGDEVFHAILIDGITGTAATETALSIGTGWDTGISVASGGITITGGALAVNTSSGITSNQATLVINAGGTVDVQDNLTADSLTTDVGGVQVPAGQGIDTSGAGALTIGNSNASSVSLCNSAGCDTVDIGTNGDIDAITIGEGNDTTTIQGSSSSTFVLNGITVDTTEFNRLDGHDAALVDTNDAVSTAIIGTGALNSGSITSGFGSIDTGTDNITTTGTVFGNAFDRSTAGALTFGNTNATSTSFCNSAACDTVTIATNGDADTVTIGEASDSVSLTSANWSITSGGIATFASLALNGDLDMQTFRILNIGNAGTDFDSSGGLTIASSGTLTANGPLVANGNVTLGDNGGDTLTLTGSSSSTFVLNGVTVDTTEFNFLDGHDAALVDTNDAVNTAITGTGALNSGSITSGFGSIDTGADNITTTGTVFGNNLDRSTAGALTFGNTNATSVSVCNSAACDTITIGTNADADTITIGDTSDAFSLASTGLNISTGGALTGVVSIDTIAVSATALTFAGAGTISSTTTSAMTLDSGTTGAVNIGTGANAKTITLGNVTGATEVDIKSGTGGVIYTLGPTSSTSTVLIGNSGTATPDLLVVDNGTGDPTGTNGGFYYNTSTNKFRCFEASAWKDCDTTGGTTTLQSAYNNGATITTAGSTDIAFTLTSGNFTATGAGSVSLTPTAASTFTSGDALTFTAGAASTWGTSAGDLSLQVGGTGATANVQIGAGGGGSTTPDLLVLDAKSTSGDPTGTNGAMYYNASSGLFRIFESGAWKTICNKTDAACGAGSGSALSAITAATTGNTIDSGDFAQEWDWSLTTAAKTAFTFGEGSAAINGAGNQSLVDIITDSGSTASPLRITSAGTADTSVNLTSTGDFVVQDAGTAFLQLLDDGTVTVGKAAAASTINLGVGSNVDTVHIGDGAGADVITIGGGSGTLAIDTSTWDVTTGGAMTGIASIDTIAVSATALTFAGAGTISSTTTSALTLDTGTTGTLNLGTGNNAKTINLGTGTAGDTINIGTNNTTADTISIGSALDTLTLTGNSSSTFVLNGVTVDTTEFNFLDGHDAALVDTNDAVNTAITGTGALNSGSITSGFGSIDTGADNITTTGTVFGNNFDRSTAGALTFGNTNATSVSVCNSAACDTITIGTNADADSYRCDLT